MTRRGLLIGVTIALGSVFASPPAGAISNGELDGTRHPNVGVVGCTTRDGAFITTAQLISPTVVLTAGHATEFFRTEPSCRSFFASFDPVFDPRTSMKLPAIAVYTDRGFNPTTFDEDVGVFVLKKPVRGITPIQLPTEGLLDQMKAAGMLQTQTFVTVGYGAEATCTSGPCSYSFDSTRRSTTESFSGLGSTWINVLLNSTASGEGGTCFGDSGGPHFLGDSNLSVGVTSFGDPWQGPNACRAQAGVQRLDIPTVRAFLGGFVTLP